jgi:hypothetical protein
MTRRNLVQYAQTTLFESKPVKCLNIYEKWFSPLMDEEIKLLELGVAAGQSMKMWSDYFVNGSIIGVDLFPQFKPEDGDTRVRIFQGSQTDTILLDKIAKECAPDGFDIIVDDCSHIGELTKISFWHLFSHHLKKGGIYAIEDWGTGYWGRHVYYPDGEFFDPAESESLLHRLASKILNTVPVEWREQSRVQKYLKRYQFRRQFKGHDYGMVGFVKQLIDELGISEWTGPMGVARPSKPPAPQRKPRFSHVLYSPGLVIVTKA